MTAKTRANLQAEYAANLADNTTGDITPQDVREAFVNTSDSFIAPEDNATLTGLTLSGQLAFTGTTHSGVKLLSLTSTQRDALTPAAGMVIYNSTTVAVEAYVGGAWTDIGGDMSGKADVAGETFTGQIQFSGTTHAGIKLISLTTTQRNALTPAVGMTIYNTTTSKVEAYEGSAWVQLHPGVQAELDAIIAGGGATLVTLESTIAALAADAGAAADPATDANHWAATDGLYLATAQSLGEAEVMQTLVPASNAVTIDGSLFFNAACTITGNLDFDVVQNLSQRHRYVYITASGGTRTVTASGADVDSNFGAGVALVSGTTGKFAFYDDADGDTVCEFLGADDWLLNLGAPAASTSVAGIAELATTAEVNTGTDTGRVVTPDALAGSIFGTVLLQFTLANPTSDLTTGDGKYYFHVPAELSGMNIVGVVAAVVTAGTTGTSDFQVARIRSGTPADVLSTKVTIDSTETSSLTAATPAVINTSNDDLATGDWIRIDVDAVSTTKPKGGIVTVKAQLP